MIRLLDLPYAPQLEARLQLVPHLSATSDATVRDRLRAILDVLGFEMDWGGWIKTSSADGDSYLGTDAYLDEMEDTDPIDWWKARGWDVAGEDGSCARICSLLMPAMLCIEEGRGGNDKMAIEAALWKTERTISEFPSPTRQKQDAAFLNLGKSRRRTA